MFEMNANYEENNVRFGIQNNWIIAYYVTEFYVYKYYYVYYKSKCRVIVHKVCNIWEYQ